MPCTVHAKFNTFGMLGARAGPSQPYRQRNICFVQGYNVIIPSNLQVEPCQTLSEQMLSPTLEGKKNWTSY